MTILPYTKVLTLSIILNHNRNSDASPNPNPNLKPNPNSKPIWCDGYINFIREVADSYVRHFPRGGGHSTFFQVGVCGPDFRSVGLANWHLPLKRGACERKISKFGGLRAENFQIWGLVSWKFPNLGACELKFGWKLRLLRLKFPNFLKRGSCELTLLLEMGPLRAAGEAWKGGLQGRTSPYPLSRSVPPRGIFIRDTAYFIAIQWIIRSYFIE